MTTLDACTSFCTAVTTELGPLLSNVLFGGLLALLVWWRGRKQLAAAIKPLAERTDAAEKKASEAHVQLARIEGSLRPAAGITGPSSFMPSRPPLIGSSSSDSQTRLEPVAFPELGPGVPRPHPSMPNPDLTPDSLPRPSAVPRFDDDDNRQGG